ncbi:MAG TPA: hypothetical protein VI431_01040 [Candidatus Acidoferrum sp.]
MSQQSLKALVLGLALGGVQFLIIDFQKPVDFTILGLTHGEKLLLAMLLSQLVEAPKRLIKDFGLDFAVEQVSRQAIGIELWDQGRIRDVGKNWSTCALGEEEEGDH